MKLKNQNKKDAKIIIFVEISIIREILLKLFQKIEKHNIAIEFISIKE